MDQLLPPLQVIYPVNLWVIGMAVLRVTFFMSQQLSIEILQFQAVSSVNLGSPFAVGQKIRGHRGHLLRWAASE